MTTGFQHECTQSDEIKALSAKMDKVIDRLGDGDVTLATLAQELTSVKEQTTKTNGRVTGLEQWKATVRGIVTGAAIINAPIALYILAQVFGK